MGYLVQYFCYFQGYWKFRKSNYGDICRFIRDICLFTSRDIGYLVPPYTSLYIVPAYRGFSIILSCKVQGWGIWGVIILITSSYTSCSILVRPVSSWSRVLNYSSPRKEDYLSNSLQNCTFTSLILHGSNSNNVFCFVHLSNWWGDDRGSKWH